MPYIFSACPAPLMSCFPEIPDDEIAIMHGAMALVTQKLHDGASVEETFTAVLNYVAASEKQGTVQGGRAFRAGLHSWADAKRA